MEYNHRPNVGDEVYVIHPSYRNGVPARHQRAKVIKVARAFVTLEEIPEPGVEKYQRQTWKMRIIGQRQDSDYSYTPYYRTAQQIKTHQLYVTSRDFLNANGIRLEGKQWSDERAVIRLAFHVADLIQPTPTDD